MQIATPAAALTLGMLALLSGSSVDARAASTAPRRPVVVELFTAQGCASCPQANQRLADIAEKKGVIALTFSVDYWDYLGWKDTLARPEFTQRQRAYSAKLKLKEIYTPEMVVNGRREAPGMDDDKVDAALEAETRAAARRDAPEITFARNGERVSVGPGDVPRGGAEVWLVRYDPTKRSVRVRSGDNAGKTVVVVDAVRELIRLGPWTGKMRTYKTPASAATPALESVVLVQGKAGGPILAAEKD